LNGRDKNIQAEIHQSLLSQFFLPAKIFHLKGGNKGQDGRIFILVNLNPVCNCVDSQ
jgi:hypothetical protein